jgi:type I restriction enzyme, S subunit
MSGLPSGWTSAPLVDVCNSIVTGRRPKGGVRGIVEGVLSLGGEHVSERGHVKLDTPRYVPSEFARNIPDARVIPGDTLVVKDGATTGKVAIADSRFQELPAYVNEHVFLCRAHKEIDPRYVFAFLRSDDGRSAILSDFRGAAQGGIGREFSQKVVVPVAPTVEQRRIMGKIDSLSGRSRRAREHLGHVPSLVEKYKQAVLAAAFRGDLTRDWRATNGIVDDAPITAEIETPYPQSFTAPSSWRLFRFEDVCTIEGGSQPPKSTFEYSPGPHLIRFVQIRDYKSDDRITFIPKVLARRFCSAHDIMIGRYGPPIFQILRGIEGAYNVALMKAVPDSRVVETEYLFRYLNHPALRAYVEFEAQRTAGQDGVNKRHLLAWPILLPPRPEQKEIIRHVDRMMAWINRLASEATSARKLIDNLDQAILAKAFRGELVPQDPNDEPASVLLERIRAERSAQPATARRGRRSRAAAGAE